MPGPISTVALNALFLDPGRSGGPETFLRELIPALVAEFPAVRFVLYTSAAGGRALRAEGWGDMVELVALRANEGERVRRTVAEQVGLPLLVRNRRADVLHSLASVAPIVAGTPAVVTLHDVTFLRVATFSGTTTFGMRFFIGRAAPRADALVAVSASARDEICAVLDLDAARFTVVPNGPGRPPSSMPTGAEVLRRRYGLDAERIVLCVAAKRPHKNQELLVRAAASLPDGWLVVLAGHPEPYDAVLRRLAAEQGVEARVRFLDYVPDPDLEGLWGMAACAVLPTRGEGFGLPVLEAMRRGIPVACSDLAVLREVAGDAARYFDPVQPQAAAAAIVSAVAARDKLEPAGRRRAQRFSWTEAARGNFEVYERVVAARRRRR